MTTIHRPSTPPVTANRPRSGPFAVLLARAPQWTSTAAVVLGLLLLTDSLWPHSRHLLAPIAPGLPPQARATAAAVVAVSGWLLLRIARGLRMHKRAEWRIAVVVSSAVVLADLLRDDRRFVQAAVAALLLALLVLARSRFTAKADPHGRWFALRVALQFLAVAVTYGLVMLYLPGRVPATTTLWQRLQEIWWSLLGWGGTLPIRGDEFAAAFHLVLFGFGLLALVGGIVLAVRPVQPPAGLDGTDEQRLRELLRKHGDRDSLGYFALRRDKSVVWSASGKAAITYRVVSGVALVSGDPIGDPEAWPGAIDAYRDLVEQHGWTPAVMGCSELGATVFQRQYGLAALELGDEAILSAGTFTLQGRAMRGVRQACTRVERAGYTVRVQRAADLDADEFAALRSAAAAWRVDPVERGFSMALSRLGDPGDPDCVVVSAVKDGRLCGLLHFVPWSSTGISLDLMRRDRAADNGLNEYMIATLMAACPSLGVEKVSLNFAVFRDALERGEQIGAGPVLRLWRRVLLLASRWWQIESLYRFNAKFQPEWQPRFVSYPRARDIPRVALAAMQAEAFLVTPPLVSRLLGRPA